MNIDINDNFEEYHEDFIKGLNKREALYVGLMIVVGAAVYMTAFMVFHAPSVVCTYAVIPFVLPFGLIGFYKIRGMTIPEWLKRRRELNSVPFYVYKGDFEKDDKKSRKNDNTKKDDKKQIYFESLDP